MWMRQDNNIRAGFSRNACKWFIIAWALILFQSGSATSVIGQDIKAGIILPLTGRLAEVGEIEQKSFLMAAAEINAAGGIHEKRIELIIEDTGGIAGTGRSAVAKLISEDRVVVLSGGCSSRAAYAAAEIAQRSRVPFLITTASAEKITEMGWNYIFRLASPASEYPETMFHFISKAARIKSAVIIYGITHGQKCARTFLRFCNKKGIKVLMRAGHGPDDLEFKSLLIKVRLKRPDLVYMAMDGMEASLLMQRARQLDLCPRLFVGCGSGFISPDFRDTSGGSSEYIFSPARWSPSVSYPGVKGFCDRFTELHDSAPDYHGAQAYASMHVIADALKRAKSLTPGEIRDAFADTDLMTVFGPARFVSYGKKTQQNRIPSLWVQWINGELEAVWPKRIAKGEYVYPFPGWYQWRASKR
jgi:branched-chain amino acid transport system substrate-binding protein